MTVQQEVKRLPVVVDLVAIMYDVVKGAQYPREQEAQEYKDCARFPPVKDPVQDNNLTPVSLALMRHCKEHCSFPRAPMATPRPMARLIPALPCPLRGEWQGARAPVPSLTKPKHHAQSAFGSFPRITKAYHVIRGALSFTDMQDLGEPIEAKLRENLMNALRMHTPTSTIGF